MSNPCLEMFVLIIVGIVLQSTGSRSSNNNIGGSTSLNGQQLMANSNGLQCQRIAVSACQGLGYNMTALPNLAGHTNQLEAELQIAKFLPLIESGCSRRARFLLCSALFPLCTPDVPRPVTACKSLCETVKGECAVQASPELMELWPQFLTCDTLPQPEKHELCMQIPQQEEQREKEREMEQEKERADTQDGAAIAGGVIGVQAAQPYWSNWLAWKMSADQISGNSNHPLTGSSITSISSNNVICPQNFTINPLNAQECLPQCQRDAFHSSQQKKLTESFILGLSAICFVLTLFALVTFWAEPRRFGYPERPVLFLCLCYNLFSICYLERIVFHNQSRSRAIYEPISTVCTLLSPPCLASYISTSYLSLCAATWWLIFALCFYLSSHKKWSSEALEKHSGLFHVLAWVPPLAPPIAALLLEKVHPSELTGMCMAPGFVEVPALILLLLGLYFTLRASRSLHSLQQQHQLHLQHQQRFSQLRKRFVIFSLLFFIPTAAGLMLGAFYRDLGGAPPTIVPSCSTLEDCSPPDKLSAWPSLMRVFFQLLGGTLTGLWVWSRKTCESYRSRLVGGNPIMNATTTTKHLHVKNMHITNSPLYAGISFHNVPVYNPHQSRV
ncbi:frizzled-3 [Drosophila tropicalis]|uniref:frizzled-3 n=1 Tax=Drosophila tropicalis TaxID=46794 RepID=UPI0035AB6B02